MSIREDETWFEWLLPPVLREDGPLHALREALPNAAAEQGASWPAGARAGVEIKALQSRLHELERQVTAAGLVSRTVLQLLLDKKLVTPDDVVRALGSNASHGGLDTASE